MVLYRAIYNIQVTIVQGMRDVSLPYASLPGRGVLPNGLRYVILRNAMPPKRFEVVGETLKWTGYGWEPEENDFTKYFRK